MSERAMHRRVSASHASWGIVDQAVSSLGNFLLGLSIARYAGVEELGAFGVTFSMYSLVLIITRAYVTTPFMMAHGTYGSSITRSPANAVGASLITGALCAIPLLVVSALLAPVNTSTALFLAILGACSPALCMQDCLRIVLLQTRRTSMMTLIDAAWLLAQGVISAILVMVSPLHLATWLMLAWAGAALPAALLGLGLISERPSIRGGRMFLRDRLRQGTALSVEGIAAGGAFQIAFVVLAGVGGLAASAGIRASQVLLGPVNIIIQGGGLVATPLAIRYGVQHPRKVYRLCATLSLGTILVLCVCYGAYRLLPRYALDAVFGSNTLTIAGSTLFPVALMLALLSVGNYTVIGFRAFGVVRASLIVRLATAPLPVAAVIIGWNLGGVEGTAYALAAAAGALAVILVLVLKHIERKARGVGTEPVTRVPERASD